MTVAVLWIILKVLSAIGVSVGVIYWMMLTKDGRTFSAWAIGIGAAIGFAALIPVLMGAAFLWFLYYILAMFL
tara:strand:- start:51 stop:269 length:219 start_codon:yes stop_codon:yes gene_type:complete